MPKVISLLNHKPKDKEENNKPSEKTEVDFAAIEAANKVKAERLAKNRAKDNESVKRSYRLK